MNVKLFRFVLFFEVPYTTVPIITRIYAVVVIYLTFFQGQEGLQGSLGEVGPLGEKVVYFLTYVCIKQAINLI